MCRLLFVASPKPITPNPFLGEFATIAEQSHKWQGDGWGIAYQQGQDWQTYRSLAPIWKDRSSFTFPSTSKFLAHTRGALVKGSITMEYVHPFFRDEYIFAFNGLVRGMKLAIDGGIGAIKIFNLVVNTIRELGDEMTAIKHTSDLLVARSKSYTAINYILMNTKTCKTYAHSRYSESPEYFAIRHTTTEEGTTVICSQKFGIPSEVPNVGKEYQWKTMESGDTVEFSS